MRHIGKLAVLAASAATAGGFAFFASGRIAAAASGVRRGTCANPLPHASGGAAMAQVPIVASQMRALWPSMVGGTMTEAAVEIALAQAMLESGIGTWWKDKTSEGEGRGSMVGSHNLGARQCGLRDEGGSDYTCVEYGDSRPNADGTQTYFPAKFRFYNSLEAGVKDFLYSITRQWPAVAELQSGDVLGYAIKQGPKYRADDKPNQSVFGREYKGGNGYYGGFGATMQDRVGGYGRAIASHLPAIAAALGHTKIEACIAPELAAKGKTHASTAGADIGAAYTALHVSGLLPRARVIPGTHGTKIIWYLESPAEVSGTCCGSTEARNPFCGCVSCTDTSGPHVHAVCPDASKEPPVGGIGTGIAVGLISAVLATAAGKVIEDKIEDRENIAKAKRIIAGIRGIGFDLLNPGATPSAGWQATGANDARLLDALAFLGSQRDEVLQNLVSAGYGFQKKDVAPIAKVSGGCCSPPEPEDIDDINEFVAAVQAGEEVTVTTADIETIEGPATGIVIAIVGAALATAAGIGVEKILKKDDGAKQVIGALRTAGFDVIDPKGSPRKGWVEVQPANSPKLLASLEFLGDKRDTVLREMAAKGLRFQAQIRVRIPKAIVDAAKKPARSGLDEDRGSIAALRAIPGVTVTTLEEDRGSLSALPAPVAAAASPSAPAALAPSQDVTRDEMVAMFPDYTPAQIDAAMKEHGTPIQGIEGFAAGLTTGLGVVASLAIVAASVGIVSSAWFAVEVIRALRRADFDVLAPGAAVKPGWTVVASDDPRLLKAIESVGDSRDIGLMLKAFTEKGWRIQAKSSSVDSVSGEKDVTPEHAAATDAFMTRDASVEGVGTIAAVVGGGLAAGVLAAVALQKKEEPPAPFVPAPVVAPAPTAPPAPPPLTKAQQEAKFATANLSKLKDELARLLAQVPPDNDAVNRKLAEVKEAESRVAATASVSGISGLASDVKRAADNAFPISGVVSPAAGAVAAFVSGSIVGGSAVLLTQKALAAPRNATAITPEPPPPIVPPPAPQPRTYTVKDGDSPFKIAVLYNASNRGSWWKELADANPQKEKKGVPWGWKQLLPGEVLVIPREWPAARVAVEGTGKTAAVVAGGLLAAAATGIGIAAVVNPEKAKANFDKFVHGEPVPKSSLQGVIQWGHIGAKNEPDEVDKAVATGSDVADAAGGLLQLVSAGKRIAERQATAPDPECRKKVKAFVERHPLIARWYASELRQLAGSEPSAISLGASMSWGDLVEWFKNTSPPGDACCVDGRWMPDCPDTHPDKAKCHPNFIERLKRAIHLGGLEQTPIEGAGKIAAVVAGSTVLALAALAVADPMAQTKVGKTVSNAMNSLSGSFSEGYTDELIRHRSERGIECSGAPTEEEDKAVLGAMMAPLGLSREEEDAVYTAASRGAGTLLDLYAPGAGQGATQAADAISQLVTGRKMAPHAQPAKPAKVGPDKSAMLNAALRTERAKVAKFNAWMQAHPLRTLFVPNEIRNISGVEASGAIDAIVPAHNEESTVADVARALIQSGAFGRVIVVDDGSTDKTSEQAKLGGAEVVRLEKNIGKTGAMMAGVEQSTARDIAFFDADAVNMKPEYATALAGEYRKGGYAQVCGVLDHGIMNTSRLATGQRIVRRDVLEGIPKTCNGYSAETAINYIADKFGPTQTVLLAGLQFRAKSEKVGVVAGMAQGAKMLGEMTAAQVALSRSNGATCALSETESRKDIQ